MQKITMKAARVNAGMTQKEASESLNVAISTLKNWENGKTFPKQPMIEKLCNLYGIQYNYIDFSARR